MLLWNAHESMQVVEEPGVEGEGCVYKYYPAFQCKVLDHLLHFQLWGYQEECQNDLVCMELSPECAQYLMCMFGLGALGSYYWISCFLHDYN